MTSLSLETNSEVNSDRKLRPGYYMKIFGFVGKPTIVHPAHFYINSKKLLL